MVDLFEPHSNGIRDMAERINIAHLGAKLLDLFGIVT